LPSGLVQELVNYISAGGVVVFFPNSAGDISSYNSLLTALKINTITGIDSSKTQVEKLNYKADIYSNVFKKAEENADLPTIYQHFVFTNTTKNAEEDILSTQKGHKILSFLNYRKGRIYISAIPLSAKSSNFAKHPVFVPTLYNIVLYSQISPRIYYTIGSDEAIDINHRKVDDYNMLHIVNAAKTYDFIPQHTPDIDDASTKLFMQGNIKYADNYLVKGNDTPIIGLSFNYNRMESDLSYFKEDEITENIKKLDLRNFVLIESANRYFTKTLQQINQGKQLWKWFIIFTLLFFGAEIVLTRFWK